jgi:Na+/proline symporter
MLLVGIGLYAYYAQYPLGEADAALIAKNRNNIFPLFIIRAVPTGLAGLLIAGIFAAAVGSLNGVLTSLSQTTIHAFYLPLKKGYGSVSAGAAASAAADRSLVLVSRLTVLLWGTVLCAMAYVAQAATGKFPEILNLALSMAGYTGGALLAGYLLAFLRLGIDGRGFLWSGPLSVLMIFALVWHQPWTHVVCWAGAAIILTLWLWLPLKRGRSSFSDAGRPILGSHTAQTVVLILALALVLWVNYCGHLGTTPDPKTGKETFVTIAWPWFTPIGSIVAFAFGYLLARKKETSPTSRGL